MAGKDRTTTEGTVSKNIQSSGRNNEKGSLTPLSVDEALSDLLKSNQDKSNG